MQTQIKIITLLFVLISSNLYSQTNYPFDMEPGFGFELQIGYPTLNLDPLKETRDNGLTSFEFPAKVTDDYPHLPYFQGELLYCSKLFDLGLAFSFLTTGTRVHYSDYSGEYKFDNVISNYEYGLIIKTKDVNRDSPYGVQSYVEVGYSSLRMKSTEYILIGNQKQSNDDLFTNTLLFCELGLKGNYYFDNFIASIGISYFLEFENELSIGFDGFRAHIGIGYRLPFSKK